MLIEVNNRGDILRGHPEISDGLNIFGNIHGRIDPASLEVEPWSPSEHEIRSLSDRDIFLTHGDASVWRVENGRLLYAAPDIAGIHDVFFAKLSDDTWLLSNDFFEIAAVTPDLQINEEAVRYFVPHGYFYEKATYFTSILRVQAGTRLTFAQGQISHESLFSSVFAGVYPRTRTYEDFKRIMESVCRAEKPDSRDAILLSGGWDSALLAIQMQRLTREQVHAVTFRYSPEKDANSTDVYTSGVLAELIGLKHHIVDVNLNHVSAGLLGGLIERMPLAAHMAVNVLAGTRGLHALGIKRTWCGQNADSIYNLGPTSRWKKGQGKIDLIKRLYLSRPFIQSLADVRGDGLDVPANVAAHLGRRLAEIHFKGKKFRIPENFNELLRAFRQAENYLALLPRGAAVIPGLNESITSQTARERLFDEKLSSFLTGRDSRVMHYAAVINGNEPVNPFSSPAILLYFRGLELGWRDVWNPKRFIRQYLVELMGKADFKRIYGRRAWLPPTKGVKSVVWQKDLINQTPFGREILEEISILSEPWLQFTREKKMQFNISLFWLTGLMKKLGREDLVKALPK